MSDTLCCTPSRCLSGPCYGEHPRMLIDVSALPDGQSLQTFGLIASIASSWPTMRCAIGLGHSPSFAGTWGITFGTIHPRRPSSQLVIPHPWWLMVWHLVAKMFEAVMQTLEPTAEPPMWASDRGWKQRCRKRRSLSNARASDPDDLGLMMITRATAPRDLTRVESFQENLHRSRGPFKKLPTTLL